MKQVSLGNKKATYASIAAAAEEYNIPYMTLYMRIYNGKTLAQAVKMPLKARSKKH